MSLQARSINICELHSHAKQAYKLRKNNKKDTAGSHHPEEQHTHASFHDLPKFKAGPSDIPNQRATTGGCPYKTGDQRFNKTIREKHGIQKARLSKAMLRIGEL